MRPVWPSQPAPCFVLADVREHATCIMGAGGNSYDIMMLSWTLSRYRDPKKVHDLSPTLMDDRIDRAYQYSVVSG